MGETRSRMRINVKKRNTEVLVDMILSPVFTWEGSLIEIHGPNAARADSNGSKPITKGLTNLALIFACSRPTTFNIINRDSENVNLA